MRQGDFERFERLIRKLESVYGKRIDDDAMQTWWRALRDLSYELVEQRVGSHIRYAKFFPKPMELRPKEDRPKETDQTEERRFKALEQENIRNWDERIKEHGASAKMLLLQAYLARIDVQYPRDSLEYAEKMRFAREAYAKLRAELSDQKIASDPNLLKVVGELDPQDFVRMSAFVSELRKPKAAA